MIRTNFPREKKKEALLLLPFDPIEEKWEQRGRKVGESGIGVGNGKIGERAKRVECNDVRGVFDEEEERLESLMMTQESRRGKREEKIELEGEFWESREEVSSSSRKKGKEMRSFELGLSSMRAE